MHEVLVGVLIWCGITIGMVSHLCKLKDDAYSDDLSVFSSYLIKGYTILSVILWVILILYGTYGLMWYMVKGDSLWIFQ